MFVTKENFIFIYDDLAKEVYRMITNLCSDPKKKQYFKCGFKYSSKELMVLVNFNKTVPPE